MATLEFHTICGNCVDAFFASQQMPPPPAMIFNMPEPCCTCGHSDQPTAEAHLIAGEMSTSFCAGHGLEGQRPWQVALLDWLEGPEDAVLDFQGTFIPPKLRLLLEAWDVTQEEAEDHRKEEEKWQRYINRDRSLDVDHDLEDKREALVTDQKEND